MLKHSRPRLATYTRLMYMGIFALTIAILLIIVINIANNIANDASQRIARQYSIEAAANFQSHISPHLVLLSQISRSTTITRWLANEADLEAKALAFDEIVGYASYSPHSRVMLTVGDSRQIYDFLAGFTDWITEDDFVSLGVISDGEEAQWFFDTRDLENPFNLNIQREMEVQDLDPGTIQMWANHRVYYQGRFVGVISIGFPFENIFEPTFGAFMPGDLRGYIIDQHGSIRVDSTRTLTVTEDGLPAFPALPEAEENPNLLEKINAQLLLRVDGLYQPGTQSLDAVRLTRGDYRYASIAPIIGTDWSIIVLSQYDDIFNFRYMPLVYVLMIVLFLSVAAGGEFMRRIVIIPLLKLTKSTSDTDAAGETVPYGLDRPDEIGDLARAIYHAQEVEREISELNQVIFDNSPFVIGLWDNNFMPVKVNKYASELFGVSNPMDITKRLFDFSPEIQPCGTPTTEKAVYYANLAFEQGYARFEWMHKSLSGEPIPVEVTYTRFIHNGKKMIVSYTRDLREFYKFKEIEKREKEISTRIKLMFDTAPLIIQYWNKNHECVDCNQTTLDFYGVTDKEKYFDQVFNVVPEMQLDGTNSKVKWNAFLDKVFEEGAWSISYDERDVKDVVAFFDVSGYRSVYKEEPVVITYSIDITKEKKAKEEHQRLKIAEESNRAKSRFLAKMSHEIRTPITAVLGISEIQLRSSNLSPNLTEAFATIHNSSNVLLGIIDDILDLSKIEEGKMDLTYEEYDVASMINDVAHLHLSYIGSNSIKFNLLVDEKLPSVLIGDALRLKQIVNNLLSNAFKYTEDGAIKLCFEYQKDETAQSQPALLISISDTGLGMTQEQLDNLQNAHVEFTRFHEQEKRHISGTGLGMSIVYSMIELMNADISFTSEVGKGTTVVISVPQKAVGCKLLGKKVALSLQQFEFSAYASAKNFNFTPEPMPYGNVLIVDDVETNLYVAKGMMAFYDLNIETCISGYAAIEKIEQGKVYDIIFMDQMMPGMDGIQTMHMMRDKGYTHPIVALTANALMGQAEEMMEMGFDDFISKPIQTLQLNAVLVKYIRDRRLSKISEGGVPEGNTAAIIDDQIDIDFVEEIREMFVKNDSAMFANINKALDEDD
ncbi:MAG: ATP-binding protein, partial [Defluviitaleaceae bacterium]|nr:ATP-binding protein [Defluviitaleaceae bacterium]